MFKRISRGEQSVLGQTDCEEADIEARSRGQPGILERDGTVGVVCGARGALSLDKAGHMVRMRRRVFEGRGGDVPLVLETGRWKNAGRRVFSLVPRRAEIVVLAVAASIHA